MVKLFAGLAAAVLATGAAGAATTTINFNSDITGLNAPGTIDFELVSGSIDLIPCATGSTCVDLDGSSNASGTIRTRNSFAFNAGDRITITADIASGSGNPELVAGALDFADAGVALENVVFQGQSLGTVSGQHIEGNTYVSSPSFQTYSFTGVATASSSFRLSFGTAGNDNVGSYLDNVRISVDAPAGVPEPATWAMMLAGFGMAGAAVRRRHMAPLAYC